jgi:hypothetical protein
MISKSKIALIAALAVSIASPAFAQSYSRGDGSGNALPFAYGQDGIKSASPADAAPVVEKFAAPRTGSQQIAVRQNGRAHAAAATTGGLYAYAAVPYAPQTGRGANSPALTGGGSTGYNEMLLNY